MELCRKAARVCQASNKPAAVATVAALMELMDIAIRVQGIYERTGTLGPGEIRFQARMYMHLQYACRTRVLQVNASAMQAFNSAVDHFIARFPASLLQQAIAPSAGATAGSGPQSVAARMLAASTSAAVALNIGNRGPTTGCYRCPEPDHYANDERFHPQATRKEKLSKETKAAIMARVDAAPISIKAKNAEKEAIKAYWAQHSL